MAQLGEFLLVVVLLLALARQFPQTNALLRRAFGQADPDASRERDTSAGPLTIDLALCAHCQRASPLTATFCTRCGNRLPRRAS